MIPYNTVIQTDQGPILVHNLTTNHSIDLQRIISIVQGTIKENYLVRLEAHSLGYRYPTQATILSANHKIYYNRRMMSVKELVNDTTITRIPYHGDMMYHVLLDYHSTMRVNHLIIETIDPRDYF
jgi:hypothetical protein